MIRLSGFGAAFLVMIAVGAGFHGERVTAAAARLMSGLAPLVEPVLWGISLAEMGGGFLVLAVFGIAVWRGFKG